MKKTQKQIIKELERLLQIKEETIKELEKQNQILKTQPVPVPVNPQPFAPITPNPINPFPLQPLYPTHQDFPWWSSQIVTKTKFTVKN